MQETKAILIFGVGDLQLSIIRRAKQRGLFTIGIDPMPNAFAKNEVDAFEVVGGQDYEGTLDVAKRYNVKAVVTAATDKPLVMMARVAKELHLPFYSVETAQWSTDKFQMKQRFIEGGVPCASGRLAKNLDEITDLQLPLIIKPRDNSGSRGVILCRNQQELADAFNEALGYSHLDSVLVEEFIEGQEYSIESLHYNGKTEVIQFTEKTTTPFPYNVELAHKQPANLTEEQKNAVREIISKIAQCMKFENCPSHTELKINERGVFVIETSPRLGGGNITSHLVPLSTGINIEDQLLSISLGEKVDTETGRINKASGVKFLELKEGYVKRIFPEIAEINYWPNIVSFHYDLKEGSEVHSFKSGLDRYGQFIIQAEDRIELDSLMNEYNFKIEKFFLLE
jgi:carbamoyl-phosphate synthase large subunit